MYSIANTEAVAHEIHGLTSEMWSMTTELQRDGMRVDKTFPLPSITTIKSMLEAQGTEGICDQENALLSPMQYVKALAEGRDHTRPLQARHTLTQTVLDALDDPSFSPGIVADIANTGVYACTEAEPRFDRDLRRKESRAGTMYNREPAAILLDVNGTPMGYEKADGERTAYIWQAGELPTAAGPRMLPADSIVELDYINPGVHRRPRLEDVVVLQGVHARDVSVLRFAASTLPPALQEATITLGADKVNLKRSYLDSVRGLTAQTVGERALRILAGRNAPTISNL
jgi:hypothetical protein